MLRVRQIPEADWPALAARFADLTYEQSRAWSAPAAARLGAGLRFLAVEREGTPVAAAAARIRTVPGLGRGVAWVASGPLTMRDGEAPSEAALTDILSALRAEVVGTDFLLRPDNPTTLSVVTLYLRRHGRLKG